MARRGPKPKSGPSKAKKRKPRPLKRPVNRYARYSKLSEAQTLSILRGFADMEQSTRIASRIGVSDKTVRETLWDIRLRLLDAVMSDRNIFYGLHRYMFDHGRLLPRGEAVLETAGHSGSFQVYAALHRLRPERMEDRQRSAVLMEGVVRGYCRMAGHPGGLFEMSDELKTTYENIMRGVQVLIDTPMTPENRDEYLEHQAEAERLLAQADQMRLDEQSVAVADNIRPHATSEQIIYRDMRKFLLKKPL